MRTLTIITILVLSAAALPAQTDITLTLPGYRVAATGPLAELNGGGLVVGKLDSLPRERRAARFGIVLPAPGPVLEVQDGVSGAVLATVNAPQWQGRESAAWKRLGDRSSATAGRVVEAFLLQQGRLSLTLVRTVERFEAAYLPLGAGIRVSWAVANASVPSVRLVLRGSLEGRAVLNGQMLSIASTEKNVPLNATLMLVWSSGASVRLDGPAASRAIAVRSGPLNATSGEDVAAFDVVVAGTTSPVSDHQSAQVSALQGHTQGQPERPLLVARTEVDRPKASPGDTVGYVLSYYNIGTAPAAEVELSNPIPDGTVYVEESAQGSNSEITTTRATVEPPATAPVTAVRWKFKGAIAPGAKRWASFKVIVQ